ncbi:hypothetical protein PT2222_10004 [Paraburkholderia tropica]
MPRTAPRFGKVLDVVVQLVGGGRAVGKIKNDGHVQHVTRSSEHDQRNACQRILAREADDFFGGWFRRWCRDHEEGPYRSARA